MDIISAINVIGLSAVGIIAAGVMGERTISLPSPRRESPVSLEKTLVERRSVRMYKDQPLTLEEVSQLLWSAQGVTHHDGLRTAPSAGALYPLEIDLVVGRVKDVPAGIYRYRPGLHDLILVSEGDHRDDVWAGALHQDFLRDGAAVMVISAVYRRTTRKYGTRGERYVHMEVGHAAQNVLLQAVALDLGAVMVGAFHDDRIRQILHLKGIEQPLSLIPIGRLTGSAGP